MGTDLFGDEIRLTGEGVLAQRYLVPPFDVIDGRADAWKARKQAWNAMGIESHLGRMGSEKWNGTALANGLGDWLEKVANDGARTDFAHGWKQHRVSVFDPVLAEVLIRWFCPEGGMVFDPYAGGSVRGIVASTLGRQYLGVDLSQEQVSANHIQAASVGAERCLWVVGDGSEWTQQLERADMVLTCPPYGTLERYSDDPRDLSTMEWSKFRRTLIDGIATQMAFLRPGSVLCYVVADYREKRNGNYTGLRPLVGAVAQAMADQGELVASCVFLTPLGTLPVRASHNWRTGGKLGRAHQNIVIGRVTA